MKRNLQSAAILIALSLNSHAASIFINFDVDGTPNTAAFDALGDGSVVSTGANGSDVWNIVTAAGAGALTASDLTQADGTATGASLSIDRSGATQLTNAFDITGKAGATDDYAMMDGLFVMDADDGDSITVANLPSGFTTGGYVVSFFLSHADTRTSTFTINGVSGVAQQPSSATFDGDFTGYFASVEVAQGNAGFTATWTANAGNPNRLNLAGMTITAVPEPSALLLGGLGVLGLLRRRR